jgi:hypothetical protein
MVRLTARAGTVTATTDITVTTSGGFVFGAEAAGNDVRWPGGTPAAIASSYADTVRSLGRDCGSRCKFFDGGQGITKAVAMRQATGAHEPNPLYALQSWDTASTKAFLDGLTYPCRICLKQEFTADIAGGSYTVGQFNSWIAAFCAQLDAHPNGHLVTFAIVGAEAAERSAPSPIWPGVVVPVRTDGTVTEVGNDTYVSTTGMLNVVKAFKASVDWITALKTAGRTDVRLSISEGATSRTAAGFTPANRVQFLTDLAAYLPTVDPNAAYSCWAPDTSSEGPAHDWSFSKPGDEVVAAKVASLIT